MPKDGGYANASLLGCGTGVRSNASESSVSEGAEILRLPKCRGSTERRGFFGNT